MSRLARFHIGVDLHKTVIQICVLEARGEIVAERRFLAHDLAEAVPVMEFLRTYRTIGRIAVEAIGVNRWFVNALKDGGYDIVVCDPAKLKLRMLGCKTDRRDAREIARRLMLGDIDRNATTWYADEKTYGHRQALRTRHDLMVQRQRSTNAIRAMLNAYKITGFPSSLSSKKSFAALSNLEMGTESQTIALQAHVSQLIATNESIAMLDQQIKSISKDTAAGELQRHVPYLGPLTAAVIVNELGDVSRFRSSRAVAAYAGLVPRVSQSADKAHHGRLTKRGNRELRHVLGEWAVRLMSHDPLVTSWAAPRLRKTHRNKVRIALARRLLIGVYKTLATGEAFSMERCLGLV